MADGKEIDYQIIRGRLSNREVHGAYLLYGDEPYYMDHICKEIKDITVGEDVLNYTKYTSMPEMGDLVSNCMGFPMFSEYKLIVVYDSGLFGSKKKDDAAEGSFQEETSSVKEELIDLIENLPDTTILIFRESSATKNLKTYKSILKHGTVVLCEKESNSNLRQFLKGYARHEKRLMSKDAADLMLLGIGNDISRLRSEVDKLVLYKAPGETITPDDVRAVCKLSLTAMTWDLTDAIMAGKKEKALIYLQALLDEKTPANMLFATITKMYLNQYNIKSLIAQGYTSDQTAAKIHIHPFVAKKYAQALRNVPAAYIAKKAEYSIELTEDVRSGKITELYALQLLVSD